MGGLYTVWWPIAAAVPGIVCGLVSSRGRHEAGIGGAAVALAALTATVALVPKDGMPSFAASVGAGFWVLSVLLSGHGRIGEAAAGAAVTAICLGVACGLGQLHYSNASGAFALPMALGAIAALSSVPAALALRWPGIRRLAVGAVTTAFAVPLASEYGVSTRAVFCVGAGVATALALDMVGAAMTTPGQRAGWRHVGAGAVALLAASGTALSFRWQAGYGVALWAVGVAAVWLASGDGRALRGLALVGACMGVLRMMFEAMGTAADLADPYGFTGMALGLGLGISASVVCGTLRGVAVAVVWTAVAVGTAAFWKIEGLQGLAAGAVAAVLTVIVLDAIEPRPAEVRDPLVPAGLGLAAYIAGMRLLPLFAGLTRAQKVQAAGIAGTVGCLLLACVWTVRLFARRSASQAAER
ncbi:MAG: hypothetical protein ACUVTZ_08680 [Armatimonadota bacterium]